jgi:CBS domain-containing protein
MVPGADPGEDETARGGAMKVREVMSSPAHSCTADTNLAAAAIVMRDYKCGALPVLDEQGRPIGILTDRDVCMAVARKNRFPAAISVHEVMTPHPLTCSPDTGLTEVVDLMTEHHVRRLPVVDAEGRLVGIVSLNDVAAVAARKRGAECPLPDPLVGALRLVDKPVGER